MVNIDAPNSLFKKYTEHYGGIFTECLPGTFTIWVCDLEKRRLRFAAPGMVLWKGWEGVFPATIDGWWYLAHPEDLQRIRMYWEDIVHMPENGDRPECLYRVRCPEGRYLRVLSRGIAVCRDDQGKAVYVVGLLVPADLLEKRLEEALTLRERAKLALEAAQDGLWDWNVENGEAYYSPHYLNMLGYSPEAFPPRIDSWRTRVHQEDLESTLRRQAAYVDSPALGDTFECTYRFMAADCTYRWILARGKVVARDQSGRAKRIVGLHTDVTELRMAQEALTQTVNHDFLTKLHSRLYFDQFFSKLGPEDHPVSVVYADVDSLKMVNDLLGHGVGDSLLIAASDILRRAVRSTDVIARMGGDEFAIVLPRCTGESARITMEKIRAALKKRNANKENMPIFISMGCAGTDEGSQLDQLLNEADQIMLRDKTLNHGKSRAAMRVWVDSHKDRRRTTNACDFTDSK